MAFETAVDDNVDGGDSGRQAATVRNSNCANMESSSRPVGNEWIFFFSPVFLGGGLCGDWVAETCSLFHPILVLKSIRKKKTN